MSRRKKRGGVPTKSPFAEIKKETLKSVGAVALLVGAIFFSLSLFELAGIAGTHTKEGLWFLFGIGAYVVPLLLTVLAVGILRTEETRSLGVIRAASAGLFLFGFLATVELLASTMGGIVGRILAKPMILFLDIWASLVILVGVLAVSLLILFDTHVSLRFSFAGLKTLLAGLVKKPAHHADTEEPTETPHATEDDKGSRSGDEYDEEEDEYEEDEEDADTVEEVPDESATSAHEGAEESNVITHTPSQEKKSAQEENDSDIAALKEPIPLTLSEYVRPPFSLLEADRGKPGGGDIKANLNLIKRTLGKFGIAIEPGDTIIGPTVTRYAIKPAEGVRISKIAGFKKDLEYALATTPIRIEAPIPGKSLVGIEVPNSSKSVVGLRPLLSSSEFQHSDKPLLVCIGKDIGGRAHYADIAKMPHCIVAGATGSGKSVMVHSLIVSLLFRNSPQDLRLILIDPKRIELTLYNGLPHLFTPVITDAKKALRALIEVSKIMQHRYHIFETEKVQSIQMYHQKIFAPALRKYREQLSRGNADPDTLPESMPNIVIVIDELAELMRQYPREVEATINQLTRLSRAAGIHLILATQRPSVDTITGTIKSNIPTRIALKTVQQNDSRTILDESGAEDLTGAGDLLYRASDEPKPVRLQSAFISDDEVRKVVTFIKTHNDGLPSHSLDLESDGEERVLMGIVGEDGGGDPRYSEARRIVIEEQKASISSLQRKMGVGYARAGKLIDMLEREGVIGPGVGAKPREVFLTPDAISSASSGSEGDARPATSPPQ